MQHIAISMAARHRVSGSTTGLYKPVSWAFLETNINPWSTSVHMQLITLMLHTFQHGKTL